MLSLKPFKFWKRSIRMAAFTISLGGLCSCAALYHVQVSDVEDARRARVIDIKLSEMAFDIKGAAKTINNYGLRQAKVFKNKEAQRFHEGMDALIAIANYGPSTGTPVFTDRYSDHLLDAIIEKCPSGQITGLTSVRESRKYPYISGEIISVRGFCID